MANGNGNGNASKQQQQQQRDLIRRLQAALEVLNNNNLDTNTTNNESNGNGTNPEQTDTIHNELRDINDGWEALWNLGSALEVIMVNGDTDNNTTTPKLQSDTAVAQKLHRHLLNYLQLESSKYNSQQKDQQDVSKLSFSHQWRRLVQQERRSALDSAAVGDDDVVVTVVVVPDIVTELVRSAKNWWRWQWLRNSLEYNDDEWKAYAAWCWQHHCSSSSSCKNESSRMYAGQWLFYMLHSLPPHQQQQRPMVQKVTSVSDHASADDDDDCWVHHQPDWWEQLVGQLLLLLTKEMNATFSSIALTLVQVQLLHWTLATEGVSPHQLRARLAGAMQQQRQQKDSPNNADNDANDTWSSSDATPTKVLDDILVHLVVDGSSSTPNHRHVQRNSLETDQLRRSYLVLEILRCYYALGMGSQWNPGDTIPQLLLQEILPIPPTPPINDETSSKDASDGHDMSIRQSLQVVTILMDATSDAWTAALFPHVPTLLDLVNYQAIEVVTNQWIDDRSAAALMPALTVLYRHTAAAAAAQNSNTGSDFWQAVHTGVFPNDVDCEAEPATPQHNNNNDSTDDGNRRMHPADAPPGTLRHVLIQLLVWPQSHVKRITGELLWSLCSGDSVQFTKRVGMGRALPFLHLKGIVDLPPQAM